MLFVLFSQFRDNPQALAAYIGAFLIAMIFAFTFHEFAHAWTATRLGDPTPGQYGRLTLNPTKHLNAVGILMILVIGFGIGGTTPVNPRAMRFGPFVGGAITSAAGPLSNLFAACVLALPLKLGWVDAPSNFGGIGNASGGELIGLVLVFVIYFNVLIGCLNLIPLPMFDGWTILMGIIPSGARLQLAPIQQYGFPIFLVLMILPLATNGAINPLGVLLRPMLDAVFRFIQ